MTMFILNQCARVWLNSLTGCMPSTVHGCGKHTHHLCLPFPFFPLLDFLWLPPPLPPFCLASAGGEPGVSAASGSLLRLSSAEASGAAGVVRAAAGGCSLLAVGVASAASSGEVGMAAVADCSEREHKIDSEV